MGQQSGHLAMQPGQPLGIQAIACGRALDFARHQPGIFEHLEVLGHGEPPATSPASLSTLRCWDTVNWASGVAATISPQIQARRSAKYLTIPKRIGLPSAFNIARRRVSSEVSARTLRPEDHRRTCHAQDSACLRPGGIYWSWVYLTCSANHIPHRRGELYA